MVWTIPNTFVAGTKARANEVNENFTSLKQFVDTLEVQASTNEINITNLENNKANINGDNQQRFQVADPTSSLDAVNLRTLENKTLNSREIITGFQLSKFNDTTITAAAGNCYDSTFEYMISQSTSLQVSNSSLGENATYYVYVCAEASTSTNQLVLDTSSTTPNLPADHDYFRRIGTVITDDDGNINTIYSDTNSVTLGDVQKAQNPSMGMPDYSRHTGRSVGQSYTEDTAGYVAAYSNSENNANIAITVDGFVAYQASQWKYVQTQKILVPVPEGSTWIASGANCSVEWIPVVGAN